MKSHAQIAVIGAGPAGLAAATKASSQGADVILFDEQPAPGGQIYRAVESATAAQKKVLGTSYARGEGLVRALRESSVDYRPASTIWQLTAEREIGVSRDGAAGIVTADRVIVAGGAIERPFPIPGWTLPGVATAGAAQILLKSSGLVSEGAIFAGSGPLLYLVVSQYLRAGLRPAALIDTTPRSNRWPALKKFAAALKRWDLLVEGAGWMREIRQASIRVERAASDLAIEGSDHAEAIVFHDGHGKPQRITGDRIFLHQGVVPNVNLTMSAGCRHHWNDRQLCWVPDVDRWYGSSLPGISIIGDGAGIAGAVAAEAAGRIAAIGVLQELGYSDAPTADKQSEPHRRKLAQENAIRPFLDLWFRPNDAHRIPDRPETIVCRCEEVTAGDLRQGIALGAPGPNQLKAFCRAGMGPCQGRMCGLTVTELLAAETGKDPEAVGYYRLRPPVKPLTLGELAALPISKE
ncbi:NAD(P)/FAD-dependent oxidoreductase [Pelagibius sp. Alg239-R121]|uniref:FAD/NAD(P)-dependent oxidoreductase n=1 Tax=Pelagibius sp. Alg239-R121 TaxID=2993448 RepID=UPI0024A77DC3|nr:(2Fe-2S)-binding protein [Pelagibius sp. Alg239-R121]